MTAVRGSRVLLRAFDRGEIDEAMARMGGVALDDDDVLGRQRRTRLERSGSRSDWEILFAVEASGRLVGDVQARSFDRAMPPGVWEVGVELWDEADRGRGLGREAVALLCSHLFETEDAIRVQATTDMGNAAMRRVLERLGFTMEGVLRGFMPGPDGQRDNAMYGMTRTDWETARNEWTRTS